MCEGLVITILFWLCSLSGWRELLTQGIPGSVLVCGRSGEWCSRGLSVSFLWVCAGDLCCVVLGISGFSRGF